MKTIKVESAALADQALAKAIAQGKAVKILIEGESRPYDIYHPPTTKDPAQFDPWDIRAYL